MEEPQAETSPTSAGGSFIESLQLDARHEQEFRAGNFLYLRLKDGAGTAYDLEVCEHHEVADGPYYTMSAAGVTYFSKTDSAFTALPLWEHEYRLYNLIRHIPFFTKYRRWKSFNEWKKLIKN